MEPKLREKRKLARFIIFKLCKGWLKFWKEVWFGTKIITIALLISSVFMATCIFLGMTLQTITFNKLPILYDKEIFSYINMRCYFNSWMVYGIITFIGIGILIVLIENSKSCISKGKREFKNFKG